MSLKVIAVVGMVVALMYGYTGVTTTTPELTALATIIGMLAFVTWRVEDIALAVEGGEAL